MNIRIIEINDIEAAKNAIDLTGADPYSVGIMAAKAVFRTVLIENADNRAAALLKQEMLSLGGEAAVSEKVSRFEKGSSNVLLMGTLKKYGLLAKKLSTQPFGLKIIAKELETALSNYSSGTVSLKAGRFSLKLGANALIMGVLNVTPDSFYDGGRYRREQEAADRALEMEGNGAAIIDVGGESSRPGAKPVDEKEEIKRVLPLIKRISKKLKVPISIDTCKPGVAKAALEEGAAIINDITALRFGGKKMAAVAVKHGAAVILMHMLGTPRTMQVNPRYIDAVNDIRDFLKERVAFARERGIGPGKILIDPGIGFGKTPKHNFEILRRLKEFRQLGLPVVVGLSRKYFIGKTLGGIPASERLPGSIAANIWAALNGANILRVHDVKETAQALKILRHIWSA